MKLILLLVYILSIVGTIKIPLKYYSKENLPFSISSKINGTLPKRDDEEIGKPFISTVNMSINPNTPFSMLFNFKGVLTNTSSMNLTIY